MPRLFVAMVVAAALTLLMPAASLGGRPTFEVTGITVTSTGLQATDYAGEAVCGWSATVSYTAAGKRAAWVDVVSQDLAKIDMARYSCPVQPDGDTTFTGIQQVMYGDEWQWSAFLVGRDGFHAVSPIAYTNTRTFTQHACPPSGTIIARYP